MLRRLTIWLLIFAIFVANCSTALIYFSFKFNQPYIAKNLFINRFKPSLHCNGKCYFMRKVRQAEQNEQKQTERGSSVRMEVSFCQEPFHINFTEPRIVADHVPAFSACNCSVSSRYKDAIFKPPPQA